MQSEPRGGIELTAYSCICCLFHRIYYDARNHKHRICTSIIKHLQRPKSFQQATNRYSLPVVSYITFRLSILSYPQAYFLVAIFFTLLLDQFIVLQPFIRSSIYQVKIVILTALNFLQFRHTQCCTIISATFKNLINSLVYLVIHSSSLND